MKTIKVRYHDNKSKKAVGIVFQKYAASVKADSDGNAIVNVDGSLLGKMVTELNKITNIEVDVGANVVEIENEEKSEVADNGEVKGE